MNLYFIFAQFLKIFSQVSSIKNIVDDRHTAPKCNERSILWFSALSALSFFRETEAPVSSAEASRRRPTPPSSLAFAAIV